MKFRTINNRVGSLRNGRARLQPPEPKFPDRMAITIKASIGVGDALQYSSLPENYFRHTGRKLVDLSMPWFFDHNPYVMRGPEFEYDGSLELWNFSPKSYDWPNPRGASEPRVYLSNAEIWASIFDCPVVLNRPRLYRYEDHPYHLRRDILLQTDGRSHGPMPDYVIRHVLDKYGDQPIYQIGTAESRDIGIPRIETATLWELASVISTAKMLIGLDSGPAWIAACYPDVIVKKLRTRPTPDVLRTWTPLEQQNIHSHWDDRCHQIFNVTERDIGFTSSFRRI